MRAREVAAPLSNAVNACGILRCLQPVKVKAAELSDELVSFSPAIYQEFVTGDRHLRINCFGDAIYPMQYRSTSLNSRDSLPPTSW